MDINQFLKNEKESKSNILFTIPKQDTKRDMPNIKNNIYQYVTTKKKGNKFNSDTELFLEEFSKIFMDRNFEIQSDLILPNLLNILCKNSIGNLMNDIHYKNGLKDGYFTLYNSSGKIVVQKMFRRGMEMQKSSGGDMFAP